MKTLSIIFAVLLSGQLFAAQDFVIAKKSCSLALNIDLDQVDIPEMIDILTEKGYDFEVREIHHSDFPLQEEFMLTAGIKNEAIGAALRLFQRAGEIDSGANIVFEKETNFPLNQKKALHKLLKKLPRCLQ